MPTGMKSGTTMRPVSTVAKLLSMMTLFVTAVAVRLIAPKSLTAAAGRSTIVMNADSAKRTLVSATTAAVVLSAIHWRAI